MIDSGRHVAERICLVVEDERPVAVLVQHVEPALEHDAVVLEEERLLDLHVLERGEALCQLRLAPARDVAGDALQLLFRDRRIPGAHLLQFRRHGPTRVDLLQQAMRRVADLHPAHPRRAVRPAGAADGAAFAHADDPPRVVLVGAAVEFGERREGQPARAVHAAARGSARRPPARAPARAGSPAARRRGPAAPSPTRPAPRPSRSRPPARSGPPARAAAPRRARPRPAARRPRPARSSISSRESTQPIGVSRRSSTAPETISRSTARVIAT